MSAPTVEKTSSGLVVGTYNASISVADANASNSPQTIAVTSTIKPIPGDFDSDVDQSDFGIFQRCYSGSGNPADPNCAD